MPYSQVIGPGDHPGPNLDLCPAGTQHGHCSAEVHPTGVLGQTPQAHPSTNPRSRTPKAAFWVVAAVKVDLQPILAALRLAGGIGFDLLLLALLTGTLDQAVGGLAKLLQEVGGLVANAVASLKNSRERALTAKLLIAEASHPEGVDDTAELGIAIGHVELLDDFVRKRLLVGPVETRDLQDRLLVVLAARLNEAGRMAQTGQQLRSTRLHVVDDDVVMATVDWRHVHIEALGVVTAQLRNQRLDLISIVKTLRSTLIAGLAEIDPPALSLAGAANEAHAVRGGTQRRRLAAPSIDLLLVIRTQGLLNIPGFASQTFDGKPAKSSLLASRGCTWRPSLSLDTSEGRAPVTRFIPASSLARRSSCCCCF